MLLDNHPWNVLEEIMSFLIILHAFFFEQQLKMRGFHLFYQSCAFENSPIWQGNFSNVVSRETGSNLLVEEGYFFVSRRKLEIA